MTKDNLLSHIVKLWYKTEGCPEKFAFRVGESLKSGIKKCGLFPFCPDVIRETVKAHHDPTIVLRRIRQVEPPQNFESLMQVLRTEHNIQNEKDLDNIKNYVMLIQKGIFPGAVLANTLQNRLFQAAPVKQRRAKNK